MAPPAVVVGGGVVITVVCEHPGVVSCIRLPPAAEVAVPASSSASVCGALTTGVLSASLARASPHELLSNSRLGPLLFASSTNSGIGVALESDDRTSLGSGWTPYNVIK